MNTKVKLTKEQSDELEILLKESSKTDIIEDHFSSAWDEGHPFNDLSKDALIQALYVGYEIEKSPEEELHDKLIWHYNSGVVFEGGMVDKFGNSMMWFRAGMKTALGIINIKVKGINK